MENTIDRWRDFAAKTQDHLGMFVIGNTFLETMTLMVGFDQGVKTDKSMLHGFSEYLGQTAPRPELAFPYLVVQKAFPDVAENEYKMLILTEHEVLIHKFYELFNQYLDLQEAK